MIKIKKAWKAYLRLGSNTRLITRITLIMFFTLFIATIYTLTASHKDNHYELLLLSDELISCAKSICGIGFIGMLITSIVEGKN